MEILIELLIGSYIELEVLDKRTFYNREIAPPKAVRT